MRLVFITIEFSAGTFSGNGVYAQSQVRALSSLGHEVLVICGKPEGHPEPSPTCGAARLVEVPLPLWGRLDAGCAWRAFAAGAAAPPAAAAVAAWGAEAVLGVDWHSLAAYEALAEALVAQKAALAPYVFMNYRVYLRTATGEEAELLKSLEKRALKRSICTTVLSRSDAQVLHEVFPEVAPYKALHVLLPALRADIMALPLPADVAAAQHAQQLNGAAAVACSSPAGCSQGGGGGSAGTVASAAAGLAALERVIDPGRGRYLLTCAVRISPEKEPDRFLDLAVELSRRGALARAGLTPLMFGAGWGSEYGQALRQRAQHELSQCIILDSFMGPAELASIYSATRLNVHPCAYDAYGMTVVEAASQGAPSLVNEGGHVGATDLLNPAASEVICKDMSRPVVELAADVEALLLGSSDGSGGGGPARLGRVGAAAAVKARSWSEAANAAELVRMVGEALGAA